MAYLLTNAILADIDPLRVERGSLRIAGDTLTARGTIERQPGDEVIDCRGAVVLPGLVNGHTHLYSALAAGMPAPTRTPQNFLEILELVWWRLDRALDTESIELSAAVGALDALRCGTTTLIDHHASPGAIEGSLDSIERGITSVGLRGVLCYEVTDRNGLAGRDRGVLENRRYLELCARRKGARFAGLAGAHASFTLGDESMEMITSLADEFGVGVHIHAAEEPCDEDACSRQHGISLIERIGKYGLLGSQHILAHGTHFSPGAVARLNVGAASVAHNPRSNMNNAVGYGPIGALRVPVLLGTDGIGADLFEEARAAWFKSRDGHAGIAPGDVIGMLVASARRASRSLGVTLGRLDPGAAADVVVTDYIPFTPLHSENLPGHFLFALASRHVRHVIAAGQWVLRERVVATIDEQSTRNTAALAAAALWDRMTGLGAS